MLNLLIVDNNLNTTSTNVASNSSNNFSLLNSTNFGASTSSFNSSSYLNQTIPPYSYEHSYSRNASTNERNIRSNDSLKFFTNSKFENNNNKNSFINNYVEKCDILKIKCKCIQILNRLVCLVSVILSIIFFKVGRKKSCYWGVRKIAGLLLLLRRIY